MLTQIYELSTPKEARSLSEIGINHLGMLVGNGAFPRELSVAAAARVADAVQPPSRVSALFLTADLSLIHQWAQELNPAIGLPAYGSAAGTIGAAAQIVFATFPVVQVWRRQARGDKIAGEMSGGIL